MLRYCFIVSLLCIWKASLVHCQDMTDEDRVKLCKECIKETGVDQATVDATMDGNFPENDAKYNAYITCCYKKLLFQDENGKILMDNIKTFLSKRVTKLTDLNVLDKCAEQSSKDHAEVAANASKCIIKILNDAGEMDNIKLE